MTIILVDIVFVIGAYLLGSLPVLYWIGRIKGFDLRQEDDMHQALWRKVGYAAGLTGILWDIFKGPIPPLIARWLGFDVLIIGLSGLAVVSGQMWPVFNKFYGKERGNTTGIGASFGIAPLAMGLAVIPIAVGALMRLASSMRRHSEAVTDRLKFSGVSNSLPLGMLIGFEILPLIAWRLHEDPVVIGTFAALFALIIFRRLTADLGKDFESDPPPRMASVLKNRFLYDRSYP